MHVRDWMTKKVYSIKPNEPIADAAKIMNDHGIKHVPVVKGKSVVGIISDRDIKEYVPSSATSLDIYELHYLLQNTKVKAIMKSKIQTTTPDTPIEEASMQLLDKCIGCLPVLDGKKLVGMISDQDIFKAMVDITGARHGGHRIALTINDTPGTIREVTDIIRDKGFSLLSILTAYESAPRGKRNIVIRTKGAGKFAKMKAVLEAAYKGVEVRKG